jgi:hypothetical protein
VFQLKAKGQEKGEHAFDKRLAVAKQLIVGRFVVKIDGDGPVVAGLAGGVSYGSPQGRWALQLMTQDGDKTEQFQGDHEERRGSTTKFGGMCLFLPADADCTRLAVPHVPLRLA